MVIPEDPPETDWGDDDWGDDPKTIALENENIALRNELEKKTQRRFPIMGGPSIPWSMISCHEWQMEKNHGQTFEEIARRGGLGPAEALAVLDDRKWEHISDKGARDELERRRAAYEELSDAWLKPDDPDNCEFCYGRKGNVKGNENIVSGVIVCDCCTEAALRIQKQTRKDMLKEML